MKSILDLCSYFLIEMETMTTPSLDSLRTTVLLSVTLCLVTILAEPLRWRLQIACWAGPAWNICQARAQSRMQWSPTTPQLTSRMAQWLSTTWTVSQAAPMAATTECRWTFCAIRMPLPSSTTLSWLTNQTLASPLFSSSQALVVLLKSATSGPGSLTMIGWCLPSQSSSESSSASSVSNSTSPSSSFQVLSWQSASSCCCSTLPSWNQRPSPGCLGLCWPDRSWWVSW